MARKRKDSRPLNVHIERAIYERLEAFCQHAGQSKTTAVERALLMYMSSMDKDREEGASENG